MTKAHVQLVTSDSARHPSWECATRDAEWIVRCDAEALKTVIERDGRVEQEWGDPLDALDWMSQTFPTPGGRWVGYLSYDLGRRFETIPSMAHDDLALPLFVFAWVPQTGSRPPDDTGRVGTAHLGRHKVGSAHPTAPSTLSRLAYQRAVGQCIDYIAAGDAFQVNLSQRFAIAVAECPKSIFHRLQQQAPAYMGALLEFEDFALISNSPELFLRVAPERHIITCPIKGTRPRLPGMDVELRDSLKDQAELNMIIDLERNDLGRVCEVGSVRVVEPRTIEAHPTVYHGVATVEGKLRRNVNFVDLLRATFPGGSITGAPKIRAMQIIEELEPVRRGPYCGAIGYIASDGTMEFNIAIRTMIIKEGLVYIPVGGGIVADSDPAAEYEETLVKARAMFAALGVAEMRNEK